MQCMFLRRGKAPEMDYVTKLWEGVEIVRQSYQNSASTSNTVPYIDEANIPNSGVVYLMSVFNGAISIFKITDGVLNTTPIMAWQIYGNRYAGIYYKTNSSRYLFYHSSLYTSGTGNGSYVNGASLSILRFSTSEKVTDSILAGMTITHLASQDSTSSAALSATIANCLQHKIILAQLGNISIWRNDTNTITQITGSGAYISGDSLRNSSTNYGGTILAFD